MLLNIVLIVIILSEITGMATRSFGRLIKTFRFYTQLSNLTALISAALLLVFGSSPWIAGLRFMAVCLLIMTMLVTIFVLVPTIKNTQLLLWSRVGFLLHLFCPVLNLISYVFLENFIIFFYVKEPSLITIFVYIVKATPRSVFSCPIK